jgi:hypothetical protein
MSRSDAPFTTIESAQEFLALLGSTIDEAIEDAQQEIAASTATEHERRAEAWQVVLYTTTKLATHVAASRRLLNDLRTLRNMLQRNPGGSSPGHPRARVEGATV